jgi:hypothetical protein
MFTLQGKVAYADGKPARGIQVAIVEDEGLRGNLLGSGRTQAGGHFQLSLLREVRKLFVVCSDKLGGMLTAVHRRDYKDLSYEHELVDLGTISLPFSEGEKPVALKRQEPIPGQHLFFKHFELDEKLIHQLAGEMRERVVSLTGLHPPPDVKLVLVDQLSDLGFRHQRHFYDVAGVKKEPNRPTAWRRLLSRLDQTYASYFAYERIIAVKRSMHQQQNLDELRLTIGHEFVHAGQYATYPELLEEEHQRARARQALRGGNSDERVQLEREHFRFQANVEGYACHIEWDILGSVLNCAETFAIPPATECGIALGIASAYWIGSKLHLVDLDEDDETTPSAKTVGVRAYRALQKGDRPAPFDPKLRPAPPPRKQG